MIQQILENCVGAVTGTGLGNCSLLEIGDLKGVGLLNRKTPIAQFNKVAFEGLIEAGKLHQLLGVEDFEVANAENEQFTSSQGFIKTIRGSKPTETLTFRKGMCFDKALASLVSNGRYELIKYFDKGVLIATNTAGTELKGFSLGMIDKMKYSQLSAGDPANSKIIYQLIDSDELDLNWVFLPYSGLDFDPLEYDGIIETNVKVISNTAGVLTVQVLDSCSGNDLTSIVPAQTSSFNLVGAVIDTVTLVTGSIEIAYTGTPTAVSLNVVKDIEGNYYKSKLVVLS